VRDAYMQEMESWASPAHLKRIRGILKRLIDDIGDMRVLDLRQDRLLVYRQRRLRQGRANRTVNQECGALKAMLTWAAQCGLIGRDPLANLKPLPSGKAHEKAPRRALTADEIATVLEAAERIDERLRARHAAEKSIADGGRGRAFREKRRRPYVPQGPLWRALLYTGARWTELTSTRWGDFDEAEQTLTLRPATTKNRRGRTLPLLDAVAEDLAGLREIHEKLLGRPPRADEHAFLGPRGKPVINSYRRALYRFHALCQEAEIEVLDQLGRKIDIHALRHTHASMLARAGVGLTQAQHLLGHSDPKLTASLYTHLEVRDLRGAVEKLLGPALSRRASG
jgi:integrase